MTIAACFSRLMPERMRDWLAAKATQMGERRSAYLGNAGIAFAVRIGGAGLGLLLQVTFARLLSLDEYGLYVTFWTWLFVAGQVSALGFNDSVLRFLPRYFSRRRFEDAAGYLANGLVWVVCGSLAIALCGITAATLLSNSPIGASVDPGLWLLVAILLGGIPILAIELYLEGVARAAGWFALATVPAYLVRPLAIVFVIGILAIAGVHLDASVAMAVAVAVTALLAAGQAAILSRRLRNRYALRKVSYRSSKKKRRLWVTATLPLVFVYGIEEFYIASDVLLLSILSEPADVGVYFAGVRVMTLAGYVYYAFMLISSREFSLARADRDHQELQRRVLYATKWTFMLTVPAVLGVLVAGYPLLKLFGDEFTAAWPVMAVLGIGLIARASVGQAGDLLVVLGHQRENLIAAAGSLLLNILLTVLLVPIFGILGAAIGTAISQTTRAALLSHLARRAAGLETSVISAFRTDPMNISSPDDATPSAATGR